MKQSLFCTHGLLLLAMAVCLCFGCSKSASVTPPPVTKPKTLADYLVAQPWKINHIVYADIVDAWRFGANTPDTLKNLVLTFKSDLTYTETGAKTESGTYAIRPGVGTDNIAILWFTPTSGTARWRYIAVLNDKTFSTYILYGPNQIQATGGYYGEMELFNH